MTVKLQAAEPPRQRYRAGEIGEAEARNALKVLESHEWVGEDRSASSRPAAAWRAKRLIEYMRAIEPKSKFTSKTWPDGKRFRWAVRRVEQSKGGRR